MDDDDDSFLYGDSKDATEVAKPTLATSVPQPISLEQTQSASQGLVAHLEAEAAGTANGITTPELARAEPQNGDGGEEERGEEEDEAEDEESDDDVEIIMEPATRSLDFRQQQQKQEKRSTSFGTPNRETAPSQQQPPPTLTTEYTPRVRAGDTRLTSTPQPSTTTPIPPLSATPSTANQKSAEGGPQPTDSPDPSTLPPAKAPPSHPSINPDIPGTLDGRSILEVDLNALAEKPWRRPGSDLSDWFNYGFDEISWEAYCYRRRELGEVASVLKSNVLTFAGMPEEQLSALPPEIRTMVIASAMMATGGGAPNGAGMMPPGAAMNMNGGALMSQMMNMAPMMNPMLQDMGMGVGPGMDMGMGTPGMGPGMGGGTGPGMMQDAGGPSVMGGGPQGGGQGTPEGQMSMGEGFGPGAGGPGQGMMGMGPDFGMQDTTTMGQQMYPGMEGSSTPVPAPTPSRSGPPPGQFRGRGMPQGMGMRGRGTYPPRGRALPVRPASPLPPNVPTGPRNKNKYKDIDGSAPAVDGLDYGGGGGGMKEGGRGTPDDERNSRKRRSSPIGDEGRSSKRR